MSIHCKIGDSKATVNYSFDKEKKTVVIKNAPIEVIAIENLAPKSNNCLSNEQGWYIILYWQGGGNVYGQRMIGDGEVLKMSDEPANTIYTNGGSCGDNNNGIQRFKNGIYEGCDQGFANSPKVINTKFFYCSSDSCQLKINHEGNLIFQETGKCPISYSVTCGEECPPGTTKCLSTNYPGYCCLPCEPTKQSIIGIKNMVKNVNKEPVSYG